MNAARSPALVVVCATQVPAAYFQRATLLGRSLQRFPQELKPRLFLLPANKGPSAAGLPEHYNRAIDELEGNVTLVFVHDDVFLHDWNLGIQLQLAFQVFDVVGIAGSRGVTHGQPGWLHDLNPAGLPVRQPGLELSGSVNHFDPTLLSPDYFGAAPMACDLLDGLLLAAPLSRLRETGVRFDPQFRFHCYDTDFCYTARSQGLRVGTWPIPVTHASAGNFDGSWADAARRLKAKLMATAEPPCPRPGGPEPPPG